MPRNVLIRRAEYVLNPRTISGNPWRFGGRVDVFDAGVMTGVGAMGVGMDDVAGVVVDVGMDVVGGDVMGVAMDVVVGAGWTLW